jgi:hypothetical protein
MYIRLAVKEGPTLINLARVSQIYLRGTTLHFQLDSSVKGDMFRFNSSPNIHTYMYETEKAAQETFDNIFKFIESHASKELK